MSNKGEQYEIECESYLASLYSCKIRRTSLSNDGGKDIIIYSPDGMIFVECKDWENTPVGRPTVQKLHSAVITEGAMKGMIMTTGTFSQDAYDYVKKYDLPIELIIYKPQDRTVVDFRKNKQEYENRPKGFFARLFTKKK